MAANPQVFQGTLNRLRASVVVPAYPQLQVTVPFLGPAGVSVARSGEATTILPTMTGVVTSPQPYQMVSITINLLRTQNLAALWETQLQSLSTIGDINVIGDSLVLPTYTFNNCSIVNIGELSFAGQDAGYMVTVGGYYQINNSLWSLG
jgi:hypothetical protein